jgi:hypothetical protein
MSTTITTTGNPNWNLTSGTTANTIINNPYLYTGITVEPTPFNISFVWDDKDVSIKLKNGNDIFKLARIFTEILDKNNIEYDIKTNKKRKQ